MADLTNEQANVLAAAVKAAGPGTRGLTDELRERLSRHGLADHPDALAADEAARAFADARVSAIAASIASNGKGLTSVMSEELTGLGRLRDPAIDQARAGRLFALLYAGDLPYDARARAMIAEIGMQADPRAVALRGSVRCDRDPETGEAITRAESERRHVERKAARVEARRAAVRGERVEP